MRLLVAKLKDLKEFLWLDELCNGLISQARYHAFFEADRENSESSKIVIRPAHAPIQGAYILTQEKDKLSLKELRDLFPECREIILGDGLQKKEIDEVSKSFSQVTLLQDFLKEQAL